MDRTWLSIGEEYVERLKKLSVEYEIEALDWQEVPTEGPLSVAFMPGEAIKTAIREFGLPRVTRIAISSFDRPGRETSDGREDGFYPGFYGIEANYKNGRVRLYVLDIGTKIVPLVSDHWPADSGEVRKTFRGNVEVWEEVPA